jgi:iron complex transport system ATP-binding protein
MIEAVNLAAAYDDREVLSDLNFRAASGSMVALLGPNGSGKSTLLRCLSGILEPTSGHVLIDGEALPRNPKTIARRVAVVPQSEDSVFEFTVREIVGMGRYPWDDFDDGHINWALENAGCQELADRKITELSGGERQRVLVARALAQGGDILLWDEPTAHMDVGYQIATLTLARELSRQGHTVVVALHDLNLASGFADRAALLHSGRVAIEGEIETVLSSPEIERVYGANFDRFFDEKSRRTLLVPEIVTERGRIVQPLRVHFIGGGGSAGALASESWQLGHKVSIGIVSDSDSDAAAARRMGMNVALSGRREIMRDDVDRAFKMIVDSDVLIVTAAPYDHGNLLNLALAYLALENGIEVWVEKQNKIWDFSNEEATKAIIALEKGGAKILDTKAIQAGLGGSKE